MPSRASAWRFSLRPRSRGTRSPPLLDQIALRRRYPKQITVDKLEEIAAKVREQGVPNSNRCNSRPPWIEKTTEKLSEKDAENLVSKATREPSSACCPVRPLRTPSPLVFTARALHLPRAASNGREAAPAGVSRRRDRAFAGPCGPCRRAQFVEDAALEPRGILALTDGQPDVLAMGRNSTSKPTALPRSGANPRTLPSLALYRADRIVVLTKSGGSYHAPGI